MLTITLHASNYNSDAVASENQGRWEWGGTGGGLGGEGRDAIVSDFCLGYKENGIQGIQYHN